MALGGGTFLTQNKILPGAYINFISVAQASATLSDRGIVTIPLAMNWGPEGKIFTVEQADFIKNSQKIFGYAYTADELKPMREIFKQLAYGRSQSAFSEDGLSIGAGLEDLGKGLRSQVGTMYSTGLKGVRYLEMAEGYVLKLALDEDNEVIGYQFVRLGKMLEDIRHGMEPGEAYKKNIGQYGRFDGAAKYIDPREE